MRIACGYLPSFALQAHARRAAHVAGRPFAVASLDPHPTVVSCSRAAWDRGVRVGMAIAQARSLASDLIVQASDAGGIEAASAAVAECLLALSDQVEVGPLPGGRAGAPAHLAVYLRVPTGTRGDSFGGKVLTQLARQGFRGRVGIADDRFAAFAAAATLRGRRVTDAHDEPPPQPSPASREREQHQHEAAPFSQTVTCVPRGGSSAFLAPLGLGLLPMDPDLLEMLGRLGIKTLGEFAALPPPTLGQGWTVSGVDLQALARGDGDGEAEMSSFRPPAVVTDGIRLEAPLAGAEPVLFLLRPLFDRVADRLRGRGTAADRVIVRLVGAGGETALELTPAHPTLSSRELVELVRARLGGRDVGAPIIGIDVVVNRESDPEGEELELFGPATPAPAPARFVSTARESHRRTMRGQRGKKGRKRGPGSGDHATGTLFD
jgi:protein ImuB